MVIPLLILSPSLLSQIYTLLPPPVVVILLGQPPHTRTTQTRSFHLEPLVVHNMSWEMMPPLSNTSSCFCALMLSTNLSNK